mgnify:FL=1|jgi:hypothetical protein
MKYFVFLILLFLLATFAAFDEGWGAGEFHGYECTKDCSGHKAGFAWAEKRGIREYSDCGGRSRSFIEGCLAWVEAEKARTSDDASNEDDRPAAKLDPSSE